tara:strand:- start:86 stop:622 length:537 start_codon:yes stop_codon:yes gene_type:complete
MNVTILRLGNRIERDYRITTHCALVARAFGANEIIISGQIDKDIKTTIQKINQNWGGDFEVKYINKWKTYLRSQKDAGNFIILSTMYGINIDEIVAEINTIYKKHNIVIVIGAGKLSPEVYDYCDLNIAVSNQPHSEVASLAIILDRIFNSKQFYKEFDNRKLIINPQKNGKSVTRID